MRKFFIIIYFFVIIITLSSQVLPTKKIAGTVYAINDVFVNMYLIEKNGKYIVVDAGNNINNIITGFKKINIDPNKVSAVFLTHADVDHVAAVNIFKNAQVYISKDEEQLMKGEIKRKYSRNLECEYQLLSDTQIVNIDEFKIECISTPGHTLGSMSFLINDIYLFTGDTISLKNGRAEPFSMKSYNMDIDMIKRSIKKLINFSSVKFIFTGHHGFTDDYKKCFEQWDN